MCVNAIELDIGEREREKEKDVDVLREGVRERWREKVTVINRKK